MKQEYNSDEKYKTFGRKGSKFFKNIPPLIDSN